MMKIIDTVLFNYFMGKNDKQQPLVFYPSRIPETITVEFKT